METSIKNLNKVQDERESMIDFIMSTKPNMLFTKYDRLYENLRSKPYANLKKQYDTLIKKMFSK